MEHEKAGIPPHTHPPTPSPDLGWLCVAIVASRCVSSWGSEESLRLSPEAAADWDWLNDKTIPFQCVNSEIAMDYNFINI